jgi:hypothetical protein
MKHKKANGVEMPNDNNLWVSDLWSSVLWSRVRLDNQKMIEALPPIVERSEYQISKLTRPRLSNLEYSRQSLCSFVYEDKTSHAATWILRMAGYYE